MTVVGIAVVLGISGYEMIRIINPEFTVAPYDYQQHETRELFFKNWPKDQPIPSEVEKVLNGEKGYQLELTSEQRKGLQGLIQALLFLVSGAVFFLIHWRIAKRERLKVS